MIETSHIFKVYSQTVETDKDSFYSKVSIS